MNNPCGLYIHIPFCSGKCPYCSFFSKTPCNTETENYVSQLIRLIEHYSAVYSDKVFDTMYIGGGTPSVIGTEKLCRIVEKSMDCFNVSSPEITVEMNPTSAQHIDFERLAKSGVNRISLGVQSSDEQELKLLGRKHNCCTVKKSVDMIRSAGIDNISLDLMIGISRQTEQSLISSIDFCIENGARHISAYILKIEEGTPYKKIYRTLNLPDEDTQADLYSLMCGYLESKGYMQYEISNFAEKGFESRHNLKYWHCDEYLGLGASAHSLMNKKRFFFPADMKSFYENVTVDDGLGASAEEYVMLGLRLSEGISFDDYLKFFSLPFPKAAVNAAAKYRKYGLVRISEKGISLTQSGFLVSNSIIADILNFI